MGSPRPRGPARARTTTLWLCRHCGRGLVAPPPALRSGSSVQCAFCHRQTRHVEGERGLINGFAGPPSRRSRVFGLPMMPASYPSVGGSKKRALLVGVSYKRTSYELRGTVNDVREMRRLLCDKFGFPGDCILELTENERDWYRVPTKENLRRAMRWLVEGASHGDSLVFHFSGHGTQEPDLIGDEVDGYDEALCPVDVEHHGTILDDEISETIVRPLGRGVKLHAIVDTCHSGTMLDLPYLCRQSSTGYWQWENHCNPAMTPKRPAGGLAISISSCRDDQRCAETKHIRESSMGVMTDSFIKAVEAEPGTTYGRLLSAMRARIRDGHENRRLRARLGSFVRRMIMPSSVQEPQLCSSEFFDIYRKPFLL